MRVDVYSEQHKEAWDDFVKKSKNGTFLFYRDFMDYHSKRFDDYSLLFYKEDILIALLPANLNNYVLYSHQGLTYGGLIMGDETKAVDVIEIFEWLIRSLKEHGLKEIVYKSIPHIYHRAPSEEDLYALFLHNADLIGRGLSSAIYLPGDRVEYSRTRNNGIKKALEVNLSVKESDDFDVFWQILSDNLFKKYNTQPTHSLDEITLLKSRFPQNIKLYGVYTSENEIIAGEVIFETPLVVHAQYTAATAAGKKIGAIDLLIDHIIRKSSVDKKYFDYGISTENNGLYLNEGLIYQKEGFGARSIVYDIYSIKLE